MFAPLNRGHQGQGFSSVHGSLKPQAASQPANAAGHRPRIAVFIFNMQNKRIFWQLFSMGSLSVYQFQNPRLCLRGSGNPIYCTWH